MTVTKCGSPRCTFAVTGVSPTHCCKVCHLTPGHHGPFCKKHVYQLEVQKERVEHKQEALVDKQRREAEEMARKHAAEQARIDAQKSMVDARIEHASHHPQGHGHHHHHHHHGHHHHHQGPPRCHGCSYNITGVNPTHCCNKCHQHPGQHGPQCQRQESHGRSMPLLNGTWKNAAGPDRTQIQMTGNQFTCTNPHQSWSPSVGTLTGNQLSFQSGGLVGLTATMQGDGARLDFSNGCAWVKQ